MKFTNASLLVLNLSTLLSSISIKVNGQIELSAGYGHTCAFERTLKELKCWGWNSSYQLNTGNTINQLRAITVSLVQVGNNTEDPGDGTGEDPGDHPDTRSLIGRTTPDMSSLVEWGVAGRYSTCMIAKDFVAVSCVGNNEGGGLGNGSSSNAVKIPTRMNLPEGTRIIKIVVNDHSCMISDQKELLCTGPNSSGQLGVGDRTIRFVPVRVTGGHTIEKLAVGGSHTCFVDGAFALLCMGHNEYGQLGTSTNDNKDIPTAIDLGDKTVKELACGRSHTCIITNLARVICTGWNYHGELGDGSNINKNVFTQISEQGDDATAIAAGLFHTCFIKSNDKVFCFGLNDYGQLGNGERINSNVPVEVDMSASVTLVGLALGHQHSCVSTTTNQVYCWGRNDGGQLGNGRSNRFFPTLVPTLVQGIDWPVPPPTTSPPLSPSESCIETVKNGLEDVHHELKQQTEYIQHKLKQQTEDIEHGIEDIGHEIEAIEHGIEDIEHEIEAIEHELHQQIEDVKFELHQQIEDVNINVQRILDILQ